MAELESIQSVPSGLLELLGMKGTGRTPGTLADSLSATVDVLQMFGVARSQLRSATVVAAAPPNRATIIVPNTEWWLLQHCNGTIVQAGATNTLISGVISISYGGSHPETPVTAKTEIRGNLGTFSTGHSTAFPFFPPRPLILGPGGRITCGFEAAGPTTSTATVSITAAIAVLS